MASTRNLQVLDASGKVAAVPGVKEQPWLALTRWSVREVHGERHLVGWNVASRQARVSSAVEWIDPWHAVALTRSGRLYELQGEPDNANEAQLTWSSWVRADDGRNSVDVTQEVWFQILEARKSSPPQLETPGQGRARQRSF